MLYLPTSCLNIISIFYERCTDSILLFHLLFISANIKSDILSPNIIFSFSILYIVTLIEVCVDQSQYQNILASQLPSNFEDSVLCNKTLYHTFGSNKIY